MHQNYLTPLEQWNIAMGSMQLKTTALGRRFIKRTTARAPSWVDDQSLLKYRRIQSGFIQNQIIDSSRSVFRVASSASPGFQTWTSQGLQLNFLHAKHQATCPLTHFMVLAIIFSVFFYCYLPWMFQYNTEMWDKYSTNKSYSENACF